MTAKNESGMEALENAVVKALGLREFDPQNALFANERQKACAEEALKYTQAAREALTGGETLDAVTILIDKAADCLMELTGEKVTDAVVEQVFSRFCVGK